MTNLELINAFYGLEEFQKREKEELKKTGKRLLQNHVMIAYKINKNKKEIAEALQPYNETREEINREFRDLTKEQETYNTEQELAKKEKRPSRPVQMIFLEGKKKGDYNKKIADLCNLETDFEPTKIQAIELEGLEITSEELGLLMFMVS